MLVDDLRSEGLGSDAEEVEGIARVVERCSSLWLVSHRVEEGECIKAIEAAQKSSQRLRDLGRLSDADTLTRIYEVLEASRDNTHL